jgi:hypothetical protein
LSLTPIKVLLAFVVLAVVWTWPVAANLTTRVAHDAGDPILNIWILWWNAQAVPFTSAWWNPPMMWPMPGAMALSEHLAGLSVVATPLQLAGMGPIGAYNVCLVLTYALSGFFAYLLVLHLTGSKLAAFCGGLAFGFSPYRASQLAHIQVLSSQWMPLALLGMHAYVTTRRGAWLWVFGVSWLLLALSNNYYLLFFPVLIALWMAWFVDWWREPRTGLVLAATWMAACLPLLPMLLKYKAVHTALDLKRTVPEIREFSAVPQSFLHGAPLLRLWPEGAAGNYELYLFPGLAVVLLAIAGVRSRFFRSRFGEYFHQINDLHRNPERKNRDLTPVALFYVLAAVAMAALALGPGGTGDEPASLARPFSWLLFLPGFDGVRVSSRFAMQGTLCLAIAAGIGVARLAPLTGRWRPLAGALAIAALAAEGLTEPVPILSPPGKALLPPLSQAAVIELPLDNQYVSVAAMYRSIFHGQPLANGYSGHFPPHYNILTLSLARGDTSPLGYLARRRPLVIIINDLQDPGHGYRRMIEAIPGIQFQGVTAGGATFVLPAQPDPKRPPVGVAIPAQVRDTGRFQMEFDLGAARQLSAVEVPLRKRYPDFASRLRIETSDDGRTWREAFADWTGGLAVEAALADPLTVPVRIPLPGASGRFVRVYPASDWMKSDLRILADYR